jgi:predicted nucleic acid-binding protein
MIVLDTNVISALMQVAPDAAVRNWLNSVQSSVVWTASVCVYEIQFGLNLLPIGKRRTALQSAFDAVLNQDLGNRVLPFDSNAANAAAAISARFLAIGRPVEVRDVMIAGIVESRNATLATRNTRHFSFAGISLLDPWQSPPPP